MSSPKNDWLDKVFDALLAPSRPSFPGAINKKRLAAKQALQTRLDDAVLAGKIEIVTKIMDAKTEGLFDNGDLFIKRKPIEQVIINEFGYETFKAIQEAIDKEHHVQKN